MHLQKSLIKINYLYLNIIISALLKIEIIILFNNNIIITIIIIIIMSGIDENINKPREFNIEKRKPTLCKFYNTKDGCKNGTSCKFLHETPDNWRTIVKKEFSPEEQIVEEIKSAILYGNLNDIFEKMLSSLDDYKKYYKTMEIQFRTIVTWKSMNKSINRILISTIKNKDIKIVNGILPFGYIPLTMFFIFNVFSWKLFDGFTDYTSERNFEVYFDEIIDCVSSLYSFEDYKEMIKIMLSYVNPFDYSTIGHILTKNFADKLICHIKSQLSKEEFNSFLNEKTDKDQTMKDWYYYFDKKSRVLDRYQHIYDSEKKYVKETDEKYAQIKQKHEYNLSNLEKKMKYYYDSVFIERKSASPTFDSSNINYDKLFNTKLNSLLKSENKFGIPYDQQVMITLLNWIPMFYSDCIDIKINTILDKLPSNLFNCNKLIEQFKEYGYITNLWRYTLNKITIDKPFTHCTELLFEFFKEIKTGLKEAYIGEYISKLQSIYESSSESDRIEFLAKISNSKLPDRIKVMIN